MEGLGLLAHSLLGLLGPWQVTYALGATLVGIVIGILPGLSATLGIALMTTLTVKMTPTDAILVLVCVYVGAIYGRRHSGILLYIPGCIAIAAVLMRRRRLAEQGRARRSLGKMMPGMVSVA